MNNKIKILSISSLLFGLSLVTPSCTNSSNSEVEDKPITNLPYEENNGRSITFKNIEKLTQGDFLDLNEIVEVKPGLDETFEEQLDTSFDYEILVDGVNPPKVQSYRLIDSSPSVMKAKTLALLRPGKQVLRVTSKGTTAYLELDINENERYQKVLDAYQKNVTNFEVTKQFAFDGNMKLVNLDKKQSLIQKTENYYFNPSEMMGIAVNQNTNVGYYYWYNEALENSLRVSPNGDYDELITAQIFKDTFGDFANIFNKDNLQFSPALNEVFGEENSYCLVYDEATEKPFLQALNLLGLKKTEKINGTTYYRTYFIPKVTSDNQLEVHSVLLSASGNAYLDGPYKIENINNVKLDAIEEFCNSSGINKMGDATFLTNKFNTYKNYTLKSEGHFESMDGKKIDDVAYFAGFLETFDLTIKVVDDAIYFSDIGMIDGSNDSEAILKDVGSSGSTETFKYVKEGSKFVKTDEKVIDPNTGSTVYGWKNSTTYGNYRPSLAFQSDSYKYASYINNGNNNYSIVGLNDSSATSAMKQFIRAISLDKFVTTSSPISYYIAAGWMDIQLGENVNDDVVCDFRVRLTTNENYVYYCMKLTVDEINTTVVSI